MECSNCGEKFKVYKKSYGRKPLLTLEHSEEVLQDILGSTNTPKGKRDERFLCLECEELLKSASIGESSKQKLFDKILPGTYVSTKRKKKATLTPQKKFKSTFFTSTPLKGKVQKSTLSTGSKYIINYHYKAGFRWFIKRSKVAKLDLISLLVRHVRKDVLCLLKQDLQITKKASFENFRNLRWDDLIQLVKSHAPILFNVLVGACTYPGNEDTLMRERLVKGKSGEISLKPVIGSLICHILAQIKPHRANMFQKMNAIQMRTAGCKRSLFSDFYHIGISVAENLLLSTLDKLADTFDKGLKQWKTELQEHIFPSNSAMETEDASSVSDDDTDISQLSSIVSSESSESMDEWEDIAKESVLEEPKLPYVENIQDIPHRYTICWDNVGKQVKARHQTRNHGNQYLSWALAYVAKNRVQNSHLIDKTVILATAVYSIINKEKK